MKFSLLVKKAYFVKCELLKALQWCHCYFPLCFYVFHHQPSLEEATSNKQGLNEPFLSLLLEPYSLLILQDSMYTGHLHGIAERTEDVTTSTVANLSSTGYQVDQEIERTCRVSLTIRYFPKTLKLKLQFGKRW